MADAHDRAISEVARDFEAVRQRRAVDDEGVVTSDGDVLRDAFVEALAVVTERRGLAMDDFARADDFAAKDFADGLMAEADAEDWHLAAEFANDLLRDSRVARDAGAWRKDDGIVFLCADVFDRRLVVADDLDLGAELAEQLEDVVGEGIVII